MVKFVIAGHGRFPSGVLSEIEMIFGPQVGIETVELADGETKTELEAKFDTALSRYADAEGILVFCDMLQGSPFQAAAIRAQADSRIRVVFGANIPMVLECVSRSMSGRSLDVEELARTAVETGLAHIGLFEPGAFDDEASDEEEDW